MHPQRNRTNIPGIIPHPAPTSVPTSEVGVVAAPSEGAPFPTSEGEAAKYWYSAPRVKRTRTRATKEIPPPRKSARLNKKMNLPSERQTGMEKFSK